MDQVQAEVLLDPFYQELKKNSEEEGSVFSWSDGLYRYHGRIVFNPESPLITEILNEMHASSLGGHSGINHTIARIRLLFWWKGMGKRITRFVSECITCQ